MALWHGSELVPPAPGVYRVLDAALGEPDPAGADQRFARWTGDYWCCWANSAQRANQCEWRGPAGGFRWSVADPEPLRDECAHVPTGPARWQRLAGALGAE